MTMLGLKSLPVNHPLHQLYRIAGGLLGALCVAFGAVALLASDDRLLGVSTSTVFAVGAVVVGLVLIGAAVAGGNTAAETNALVGALLLVIGLYDLTFMRTEDGNVMDAAMSDVIVLFVVGVVLLAAGFYGRVGVSRPSH